MITRFLFICALVASSLASAAEMKMTMEQLRSFIESSIKLKLPDRQVADYLKQVKLVHRLDDRSIEDFQGMGAGPKAVEALRNLRDLSKDLPPAPVVAPKPKPVPIPPPSSLEQGQVLKDATEYALDYSKHLPNFICTQVTYRYVDPTGTESFHSMDTVTAKLTYFEQREDYKVVLINNKSVDTTIEKLGGAVSSGEFGTMLREIFERESETKFEWDRWATLRGKRMHVFTYHVPQARSRWRILVGESQQSIVPGYKGLIYVDKDTMAVMRITLEAEDIPTNFPTFPVQQATSVLDYDYVDISGQQFILPLRYEMRMREGRVLVKNESEFRLYRKFGAEATITYTPPPLADDKTKEQKPQ